MDGKKEGRKVGKRERGGGGVIKQARIRKNGRQKKDKSDKCRKQEGRNQESMD